ncbi:hypothetical protein Taro_005850, partial [Colocasia esculenta]|nr:hypothetical protein [Colocasia esculenta]
GLELEEQVVDLEQAFSPRFLPSFGLSSTSSKSQQRIRVGHEEAGRCVSVASEVPDATVIRVTMSVCVASLSRPVSPTCLNVTTDQWVATAFCRFGRLTPVRVASMLLTRWGGPSHSGCRGLKALAGYPFPLSLLFLPFPSSPALGRLPSDDPSVEQPASSCGAAKRRRGARRRWRCVVKALHGSWATPGLRISAVCLSTDVATAVRGMRQVTSLCSATEGDTFVAVSWQWCQKGRPFVRALVGRRTILRVRACLSLAGLVVCYKPAVWRGFVVLPRLFARLHGGYSLAVPSFRGRRWSALVRTRASGGFRSVSSRSSDPWVAARPSGPLARVREVESLQWYQSEESTEICVRLPCMIRVRASGCSCCCTACVASVVARRVRAVAARLAVDSLAVVFPVWRTLAGKSRCGAPGRLRRIGCVGAAQAERACVWCGLHRCRVVCGIGGRCLCLVGCPFVVAVCVVLVLCGWSLICAPLCAVLCLVGVVAWAKQYNVTFTYYESTKGYNCSNNLNSALGVRLYRLLHESLVTVYTSLRHLPVVVVGLVLTGCELWLRCIAWLPYVLVRFSITVCCCPGEGFSQGCSMLNDALVVLVEVVPGSARVASAVLLAAMFSLMVYCAVWLGCVLVRFSQDGSWRFWWRFSPKLLHGAGSLLCFLASCVLAQMVVWAGAGVACCALSGLRSFACGLSSTMCCAMCLIVRFVCRFTICSVLEALSVPPLGHSVLACALWLYRYRCGVAALPRLGVSRVVVGNRVLYRVLPVTEWVADWLVPTVRPVGGCSRVVFGWHFPLFGPDLASLSTCGVVVPFGRTSRLSLLFFPFPSSPALGRLPSGDPSVERPASLCEAEERRRGARRRWPCIVKALRGSWVAPGLRIPVVCLLTDVTTAVRIATPVEESAWSGATLSQRGAFEGVFGATSVLELAADRVDSGAEGKMVVWTAALSRLQSSLVVLGVGPQLGQAAVLRELCVSMAALSHPSAGAEAGARLASRACGLWVPLLAASGGGLVVVVVMAFPSVIRCPSLHDGYSLVVPNLCGRRWSVLVQTRASGGSRSVSSRYHSFVLGCQSVVAPACMASRPCGVSGVRGGSTCGPSTLWRSEVAVLVARRYSHLVVAWSRWACRGFLPMCVLVSAGIVCVARPRLVVMASYCSLPLLSSTML